MTPDIYNRSDAMLEAKNTDPRPQCGILLGDAFPRGFNKMKIIFALAAAAIAAGAAPAFAGCIGPVIMGECHGSTVPWDSHQPHEQYQQQYGFSQQGHEDHTFMGNPDPHSHDWDSDPFTDF